MSRRIMGMETEYAVSGVSADGEPLEKAFLSNELVQMAARHVVSLPSGETAGLFLANGSRFYRDSGNHPELSTPECLTPWEVARYVAAGDRIVSDLARRLCERLGPTSRVDVAKVNVDYGGTGSTWGCHESYSHHLHDQEFFTDLVTHLVTRIVYTGAGGFVSLSPGLEYTLSPRVHHLTGVVSPSSTNSRGIVHTKNEDLSGGICNRLHLLCGESLFSQTASVLKVGTTALILSLLEHGAGDLAACRLCDPLGAMRSIARDPACKARVRLADGGQATAVELQRRHLAAVESALGADWLPEWAGDLCRLWRDVLARLDGAPESVCGTLDWAIKRVFFEKLIRERGLDAERIARWNGFQDQLAQRSLGEDGAFQPHLLNWQLAGREIAPQLETQIAGLLEAHGLDREEMLRFHRLRRDLFMLDARFNALGEGSVFASLQAVGVLDHEVAGVGDVAGALTEPPAGTRAQLRGRAVKRLAGRKGENLCSWDFVVDQVRGLQLDLRDPFCQSEAWAPVQPRRTTRPWFSGLATARADFLNLLRELDL